MEKGNRAGAFAPFRADDLLLLVGGNPLPNAVSARLLPRPGGRAWLLASPGTAATAKRLAEYLQRQGFVPRLLDRVETLAPEAGFTDYAHGCQTSGPQFEMDVLAMRGHQLFAFSCATAGGVKECKQKLTEARTRARQFGGDEAAAALVCLLDAGKTAQLGREVPDDRRLRVFGMADLPVLRDRVREWVLAQAGRPGDP